MRGEERYVSHPLLRPETIELRTYQKNIVETCLRGNTLVVLPTGLGKTVVAILVAAERLLLFPDSRCLVVAPTKPLILQHFEFFRSAFELEEKDFAVWTGEIPPEKRKLGDARLIFATPQILQNDIISGKLSLESFSLLVVDEAHRAVGNYAYVFLVDKYVSSARNPLVVGLTASPGSDESRIDTIARNMRTSFIEAKSEKSEDVKPYVQPVRYEFVPVILPEPIMEAKKLLEDFLREKASNISKMGLAHLRFPLSYKEVSALLAKIRAGIGSAGAIRDSNIFEGLKDLASARRVILALERLETEGVDAFLSFMEKQLSQSMRSGAPVSLKRIFTDRRIRDAIGLCQLAKKTGFTNPKLDRLKKIVVSCFNEGSRRVVIFVSYRDSANIILDLLKDTPQVMPVRLVGQADRAGDAGMSQEEQAEILSAFKAGKYNTLVATQVGEEGLDVSSSDAVIFYENTPSAIRYVQRVGRTGRSAPGNVFIMYFEGTRDEAYLWIARKGEKRMRSLVSRLSSSTPELVRQGQKVLSSFISNQREEKDRIVIIADTRESGSAVVAELAKLDVEVKLRPLDVGDYVISEHVCIERKSTKDFASSIMDGRLFQQASALKEYEKPILILEGEDIYCTSVLPQAIRGAIATLLIDFGLSLINTKTASETASMLFALARKEQLERRSMPRVRGEKKPASISEQQIYLVAGLPGVEKTTAKKLLAHFKNPERIFGASEEELKEVEGIGESKAKRIREVLKERFVEDT
ncbi:MAG: DEAD/DEAH box helicase [Thermoproteota archaeon]